MSDALQPRPDDAQDEINSEHRQVGRKHKLVGPLRAFNILGLRLKGFWRQQHGIHVLTSIAGLIVGATSLFIAVHGFVVYIREAPDRVKHSHFERLQSINSAWQTLRESHGAVGERGQTFSLQVLAENGVDMSNVDISHSTIGPVNLTNVQLFSANLSDSYFRHVTFDHATLKSADATGAIFQKSSLDRTNGLPDKMERAFLIDSVMSNSPEYGATVIQSVDLKQAILVHMRINMFLTPTDFSQACLAGVIFGDPSHPDDAPALRESNFTSAVIYGGSFRGADLSGVDFRGAKIMSPSSLYEALDENGVLPTCLLVNGHRSQVNAVTDIVIDQSVTPPGRSGYESNDAILWLGGGRVTTDFSGVNMLSTRLEGADLRNASGLNQKQLNVACVDEHTEPPGGLTLPRRRCLKVLRGQQGDVRATLIETAESECIWETYMESVDAAGREKHGDKINVSCRDQALPVQVEREVGVALY